MAMLQPPEFDGNAILAVLARHKVACVVIGNYAGLLHGVDLATEDVDIAPAASGENSERLASAGTDLDAAICVPNEPPVPLPADARLLATAEIWNLTTRFGNLDITTRPSGTDGYEDLQRNARLAARRHRRADRRRIASRHHPQQDRGGPREGPCRAPAAACRA
jgi:hypothetical protein